MESLSSSIADTISIFDLQHDINQINTISLKIEQLNHNSNQSINSFNNKLQDLQKDLTNIESSIKSLKSSSSLKTTRSSLVQLENEIFETARSLTNLNMEINSAKLSYNQDLKKLDELENELGGLKLSFSTLPELSTNDNHNHSSDSKIINDRTRIIKMKLYESLGLKIDLDKKELLILNKNDNKLRSLKIDDNYSEYFISNYIWDNM